MTLTELLKEIESKDFISSVLTPKELETKSDGTVLYSVPVLETSGDVGRFRTIEVYVLDEKLPSERAFYKDKKPVRTLQEDNALLVQYAERIKQIKGKVLEANENFIIVEAYETANGEAKKVTYMADADEVKKVTVG